MSQIHFILTGYKTQVNLYYKNHNHANIPQNDQIGPTCISISHYFNDVMLKIYRRLVDCAILDNKGITFPLVEEYGAPS